MSAKTVQDYVNDLLYVGSVRSKEGASLRADLEAYDILDQLSVSMYLYPDIALYFFLLARNALVAEIDSELKLIEVLLSSVSDSANITFAVNDYQKLSVAEGVASAASSTGGISNYQLSLFSSSVDKFLKGDVRRNVFQGTSESRRPGKEAVTSLPSDLKALKDQHSAVLSRYYALAVSIKNFSSTNFASTRGPTVLNRIKSGITSTIEQAKQDTSGASSTDMVNKLVAYKSVLSALSSSVSLSDLIVDNTAGVPEGYTLYASSPPTTAKIVGGSGPYSIPSASSMSVTSSETTVTSSFPMTTYDLNGLPRLIGKFPASYSGLGSIVITVEVSASAGFSEVTGTHATWYNSVAIDSIQPDLGKYWIRNGDSYTKSFKCDLSSCTNPSTLLSSLRACVSYSIGSPNLVAVVEYPLPLYGKFALIGEYANIQSVRVSSGGAYIHVPTQTMAWYLASTETIQALSMVPEVKAKPGPVEDYIVVESVNALFSSKAKAYLGPTGLLEIEGIESSPGSYLTISGTTGLTASLGITSPTSVASSNEVIISGKINGVEQDPFTLDIVSAGDLAICPTGASPIEFVGGGRIVLKEPVGTFSGQFGVDSLLRTLWSDTQKSLDEYLPEWLSSDFKSSLESIDRKVSVLIGDPSQAAISASVSEILKLKQLLMSVRQSIYLESLELPASYRSYSVSLAKVTIELLSERKMDKAIDLLLSGRIQEVLMSDANGLSYATSLVKSIEDVAKSELTFTDTAKTDRARVRGTRRQYG